MINNALTNKLYYFFCLIIKKGSIVLLEGEAKIGKSFAVLELIKRINPIKVIYFLLDDINEEQRERFSNILNVRLIDFQEWNNFMAMFIKELKSRCFSDAMFDMGLKSVSSQLYGLRSKIKAYEKSYGIDNQEKADNTNLFRKFIMACKGIKEDIELLFIDCMQAFFGDYQKYSYNNLQFLLQPIGAINKQRIAEGKPPLTVILIHHTNSKNDTFGGVSFGQIVTDVLRLSKANNNRIRIEHIRSRNYCENNACEVEMVFETDKSVIFKGPFEISQKNSDSCNKKRQ